MDRFCFTFANVQIDGFANGGFEWLMAVCPALNATSHGGILVMLTKVVRSARKLDSVRRLSLIPNKI